MTNSTENSTNAPNFTDLEKRLETFLTSWHFFLITIGVPWNLLVLRLALTFIGRQRKRSCHSTSTCHLTSSGSLMTQLFILNLTIVDILSLLLNGSTRFLFAAFPSIPCWITVGASHWSTIASSLSVLYLNFDRFVAIIKPLHYNLIMTKTRVYFCIGLCWLISTVWSIFFIWCTFDILSKNDRCSLTYKEIGYYAAYMGIFFITPNCISMILSIIIASAVLRRRRNPKLTSHHGSKIQLSIGSRSNSSNSDQSGKSKKTTTTTRMLTFVFVATFWACITNLTYRFFTLIGIVYYDRLTFFKEPHSPEYSILSTAFLALMYSTHFGNPFVTIFTQRRYRLMVKDIFSKKKKLEIDDKKIKLSIYSVQNESETSCERKISFH